MGQWGGRQPGNFQVGIPGSHHGLERSVDAAGDHRRPKPAQILRPPGFSMRDARGAMLGQVVRPSALTSCPVSHSTTPRSALLSCCAD
jgi:hypothetical protein